MELGYKRKEIMALLDSHLQNVSTGLEDQMAKMKQDPANSEISLATLLTSAMLSMLDAVSAVIEVNNDKIHEDLVKQGLIKE